MFTTRINSILAWILLSSLACVAQEKASPRLILKVDETVGGPFGGQKSSSCLRVYSDGRALYARSWNSRATIVDKETGTESRPEQSVSVEQHFPDTDIWELSSFFSSKQVKRLPSTFGPPHQPVDYAEFVSVQIIDPKGKEKNISTREFYVADLTEKSRYPSALIVLMDKIDEIENAVSEKGKPTAVPSDCQLNPKQK